MLRGSVKAVIADRGFGFISNPPGDDVFFHVRDCSPELPFDDSLLERIVQFEMGTDPRTGRSRAIKVRPLD